MESVFNFWSSGFLFLRWVQPEEGQSEVPKVWDQVSDMYLE